jgi:thiol-disulfide isomerase/thioredoxin
MDEPASNPTAGIPEESRASAGRNGVWLRWLSAIAVLALIVVAALALRGLGTRRSGGGFGPLDTRSPVVGQPAPNFALQEIDGKVTRLSDLRGEVVLVNFWATWCVPCRQEMPAIEQVYSEQRNQGFTVLEINEQEAPDAIRAFANQMGALPPVLLDRDGAVMRQYRLQGLPDSFIVDRQGVVHALSYGPISRQTILTYISSAQ